MIVSKRSLCSLLLTILLCFSLFAGCTTKDTPADDKATVPETTPETTEDTPAEESEAPAQGDLSAEDSNVNATGYPIVKEPITVTVSGSQDVTPDWNDTYQVQEFEKRLGIKMDCNPYSTDAWETQLTLMLASDDLPDIIANAGVSFGNTVKYGEDGYFLPLNEYEHLAPNFFSYLEDDVYRATLTAPDGNIYGVARYEPNPIGKVMRTFIDVRWLDAVGKNVPRSLDELYDVLVSFREEDANGNGDPTDEIPISTLINNSQIEPAIMSGFGIYSHGSSFIMQENDGAVFLAETTDSYRDYLSYMRRLYEEKLIDQEAFTQTSEEFRAKVSEGRVGYFADAAPFVAASQDISQDKNYDWIGGFTSENSPEYIIPISNPVGGHTLLAINANTEYPEALTRFVDYLFTEEGSLAGARGYEGITFDFVEADGMPGSKNALVRHPEGFDSAEHFRYTKAVVNNAFQLLSLYEGTQYSIIIDEKDPEILKDVLLPQFGWVVLIEQGRRDPEATEQNVYPQLVYTAEELDERSNPVSDISLYIQGAKAQFITGEKDIASDAHWEEFQASMQSMGLENVLEIEQEAYNRMFD